MSLPTAILFDLDDTLVGEGHRLPVLVQVCEEFAAALGDNNPAAVADTLERELQAFWSNSDASKAARLDGSGSGIRTARRNVIARAFERLDVPDALRQAHLFSDRFTELRATGAGVFPGAREALHDLRAQGVRLALVTNGAAELQRAKLERFSLTSLFDHVQIEGEYGFGKPDERAYVHAMAALDVQPAETWMVGDNLEWEVAAPQRLGIHAIWHDHLGRGLPATSAVRPDRIIRSVRELITPPPAPASR